MTRVLIGFCLLVKERKFLSSADPLFKRVAQRRRAMPSDIGWRERHCV